MLFKLNVWSRKSRIRPVIGVGPSGVDFEDVGPLVAGSGGEYEAMMAEIWEALGLSSWVIWSMMSEKEFGLM